MKIEGTNGATLNVDVNAATATINVSVDLGPTVALDLHTVEQLLPSLTSAKDALEQATITKRKMTLDGLRDQVAALQRQIEEIEAL